MGRTETNGALEGWPRFIAHRGASSLAPENTIAAFSIARSLGAGAVELDVHLCATGEPVVVHDSWLDRVAGVHARVEDLSLREIASIAVGIAFPDSSYRDERIPTLDEALETLGLGVRVDVELKADSIDCARLASTVARTLERHDRRDCIVSSFNPFALIEYRKYGSLPIAAIYAPGRDVPFYLRHRECLWLSRADIRKPEAGFALRREKTGKGTKPMFAWTVDAPEQARRLLEFGVNGIITNRIQDFIGL